MKLEDFEKAKLNVVHQLSLRPEYLQAIGLVSVEINSLEGTLADLLHYILEVSRPTANAMYFAPRAMAVRLAILEAANMELHTHPTLQKRVGSVIGRAKGIMTRRNEMLHDMWALDQNTDIVSKGPPKKRDKPREPVPLMVLKTLSRDMRNLMLQTIMLECEIAMAKGMPFGPPVPIPAEKKD
jgi:hypothetical protein